MKISSHGSANTDQYWLQIAAHTSARNASGAPWPLQLQVAALLGNGDIEASVTKFDGTAPSTWAVAIITAEARLLKVSMQFEDEQDRNTTEQTPVSLTVNESWVRRLSDVVSLHIGKTDMRTNAFHQVIPDVLDVADVQVGFRDGSVADLVVDQLETTSNDDRARSDGFIDALRSHTGL